MSITDDREGKADRAYEEGRMRHMEHKNNGVEYKEDCRVCQFYGGDE